jgi:hydroxypyruvate reductase
VILPRGESAPRLLRGLAGVEILHSAHPEPDASSVRAAGRALRFFAGFDADDAIVCLVSGGASSLLEKPRPGLSLADLRRRVRALAAGGAPIGELNRLRTRLSGVKGGRLGEATRARLVTLVLSDVPGDRPSVVGSGPTIRGRRRRRGVRGDVVAVVGSNRDGVVAAAREARARGLAARIADTRLSGEADRAGRALARRAVRSRPGSVWIAGGETVVRLGAARGKGGRSLEVALSAALELDRVGAADVAVLAAGSDGRDGSSSAAGAFADFTTAARARRLGLDPREALRRHATHAFFERLGDLLVTGPTGTNVGDWVFVGRF